MTSPTDLPLLDAQEAAKLAEIMRLHDEAFDASMELDGHCKSSDGQVSISLTNHTERHAGTPGLTITNVHIYAYVVGPSRGHDFPSVDAALEAVKKWHSDTMEWVAEEKAAQDEAERQAFAKGGF